MASYCEHGNEPSGSTKKAGYYLTSWVTKSFWENTLHHRVSQLIILSNYIVFGLNFVSQHCKQILESVKRRTCFRSYARFNMMWHMTSKMHECLYFFIYTILCYNFTFDWNLSFQFHSLHYILMEICSFQTVLLCCAKCVMLCKSSADSDKST